MIEIVVKMPKEKTIEAIDQIINKHKYNPIYSMDPKYAMQNERELIGHIDGNSFWIQDVKPGRPDSFAAFYGTVFDEGENAKIVGKFKMIPESKSGIIYLSVHFTLLITFLKFVSKFSWKAFFIYFLIFQLIILGFMGIMISGSKSDKSKIIGVLKNLDNPSKLRQLQKL